MVLLALSFVAILFLLILPSEEDLDLWTKSVSITLLTLIFSISCLMAPKMWAEAMSATAEIENSVGELEVALDDTSGFFLTRSVENIREVGERLYRDRMLEAESLQSNLESLDLSDDIPSAFERSCLESLEEIRRKNDKLQALLLEFRLVEPVLAETGSRVTH